jgi:hypothetical protein
MSPPGPVIRIIDKTGVRANPAGPDHGINDTTAAQSPSLTGFIVFAGHPC